MEKECSNTITDFESDLVNILEEDKVEIIGGAALSIECRTFIPNDYDVWVRCKDYLEFFSNVIEFTRHFNLYGYKTSISDMKNSIIECYVNQYKIQFIWVKTTHTMRQVIHSFDISCCMIRVFKRDNKVIIKYPNRFIYGSIKNKIAYCSGSDSERMTKYSSRGFELIVLEKAPWFSSKIKFYPSSDKDHILSSLPSVEKNMKILKACIVLNIFIRKIQKSLFYEQFEKLEL